LAGEPAADLAGPRGGDFGEIGVGYRRIAAVWKGLLLASVVAGSAAAEGERAGDFDYYVLALSWSPAWCDREGDGRGGQDQCEDPGWTFALHGLWPQHEDGWPSWCRTGQRDASRTETAGMADIMGSEGAAWYQWKKHGRCSGLSARDYFAAARSAYGAVRVPEVLTRVRREVRLPASVVEAAMLETNPDLTAGMVTVTCDEGAIAEVRICLTRDLAPRPCAPDAARDCRLRDAVLLPVR
jgi:ribonuclease T2